MKEFNDFLKHIRNVHLLFVLASIVIIMAVSSSNSTYQAAVNQLHDVITIEKALTADSIANSISKSAKLSPDKKRLENFIEESLHEYFEAKELYLDSFQIEFFNVDIKKEKQYGYYPNIEDEYYYLSEDKKYWFGQQLCLLSDGTNQYTNPYDLKLLTISKQTTINDYREYLNRILKADKLYMEPIFYSGYFSGSTRVSKHYRFISEDIQKQLIEMKKVNLSVKLIKVNLTNERSRDVFKESQDHVKEDPVGYEDYDFMFDTFMLEVRAYNDNNQKHVSFNIELPVMFHVVTPRLFPDLLSQSNFDKAYYSRYISGANTFDNLFPELANATKNLKSVIPEDLELYLKDQARANNAPITILGLQIKRNLIEIWGVLLMLGIQFYFCMHYRVLIQRMPKKVETIFPWIGLYTDRLSTIAFQISIALPLAVCLLIRFYFVEQSGLNLLLLCWIILALVLFIWTEILYIHYRKKILSQ